MFPSVLSALLCSIFRPLRLSHGSSSLEPSLRKRPLPFGYSLDWHDGRRGKPRLELSLKGVGLFDLPVGVLRYRILSPDVLDYCSLGVCRFVCRKLRDLLPRKMIPPAHDQWDMDYWPFLKPELLDSMVGGCLLTGAVVHGRIGVVKWALQQGARFHSNLLIHAAAAGQLELLKWLVQESRLKLADHDLDLPIVFAEALQNGCLGVAKWLVPFVGRAAELDSSTFSRISEGGHVPLLRWRHRRRRFSRRQLEDIAWKAAFFGRLDVMQWLRQTNRSFFTTWLTRLKEWAFNGAVKGGNEEMVRWLHACGAEVTLEVVAQIVGQDELKLLKFCREIEALWNDEYVVLTAGYYSLACLQYLLAEGVPWPADFFEGAIEAGGACFRRTDHFPALEYARQRGIKWNDAKMAKISASTHSGPLRDWILANLRQ
jgi:hypothetical protein